MNLREITQYLSNCPHGATCLRIAKDLDLDPLAVESAMHYLHRYKKIYALQPGRVLSDSVWAVYKKPHVSVFNANEILQAFQSAAMAKLLVANGVVA